MRIQILKAGGASLGFRNYDSLIQNGDTIYLHPKYYQVVRVVHALDNNVTGIIVNDISRAEDIDENVALGVE